MSEMVERVARALHRAHYERGRRLYPEGAWELLDRFERENWMFSARAAIEAMREPTFNMETAGDFFPHVDAAEQWRAMIDTTLAD